MTIHRALAELKLIDSRIEKGISTLVSCGVMQEGKKVNNVYDKTEFEKGVTGDLQSVTDLIDRKFKIKSAIVKANASTKVEIAGKELTIAEAISYKSIIDAKRLLSGAIEGSFKGNVASMNKNNETVEANAISLAQHALGKDNVKISDTDAESIIKPYLKAHTFTLVDPFGAEDKAADLANEVDAFEVEVDATLSEINAITFIEI